MLLMNKKNIIDIYNGKKLATLRPFKGKNKNYLKEGSIQRIHLTPYDKDFYMKVKITKRGVVNVNELDEKYFSVLGYKSRKEYMNEEVNKKNKSSLRVIYFFKIFIVNTSKMQELL